MLKSKVFYVGDSLPPADQRNWPAPYVIRVGGLKIFIREESDKNWPSIDAQLRDELYYGEIPSQVLVEPLQSI